MLIEALAMPKDIIREGKSDYQRREDQARADVQKQFGGRFQTYDTGSIYPQYAPRKGYAKGGIAGFAKGGESFPDLNNKTVGTPRTEYFVGSLGWLSIS